MFAMGREQDAAAPDPFAEDRQRVFGVPQQGQAADELGAALGLRHIAQHLEQLGVVRRVALAIGVARRVDAGRAAQGIHRQAGVVGECWQAGNPGGVTGLEDGVLDEAEAGFFRLDFAELGDRAHFYAIAEHGLEFLEFAGVVAGQHQFFEGHHSSGKNSWSKLKLCGASSPRCTLRVKFSISWSLKGNCAR
ncbi:hypothetical protein D3C84_548060 [compost metagenome]